MCLLQLAKVLGRDYTPSSFYKKLNDQFQAEPMQYYYGKDDPDLEPYEEDWITKELDPGTELMIEKTIITFADMSSIRWMGCVKLLHKAGILVTSI